MAFKWSVAPNQAFPQLVQAYTRTIMVSGRRVAASRAEEGAQWMKDNAPWQDRTGAARAGLHVQVKESPGVLAELIFSHGENVPYAIWLEVANQGRFGIISKAIDHYGPIFMRDMQRIMNLGLAAR